ncbi:hypothetical protein K504DRAFT_452517 [Pleomassaria siparia CBS 279.74]|uniref:Carrier domain-containing protein n=1 Tax=Pleomassaria siparia CBS 279.74 TaxID=1314801 RepID=A0A6G1KHP1_9PLEO|nr:hypothetical protein K504DRAFT_452517 [Pleomassaria siparia CBS 279.74]
MLRSPTKELSILNKHPALLDGPTLLHDLIPSYSTTAAPAIDFLEHGSIRTRLSYESLHTLSDALAQQITHSLAKLQNASTIIPVLLPQSPELYITVVAILKAGKAFCPLGIGTPEERLKFILDDVSADVIITDSLQRNNIPQADNLQVLVVDSSFLEQNDTLDVEHPQVSTKDLAYVLYTSGSTGLPKAVSVSHRAVTQSLLAHDRHVPDFTRFLQFAAPTFDVSIFEIFFPLFRGKTVVGCTRSHMLENLSGVICELEVDAAELTPTVVSNLLSGRACVPGLRLLLTIGEMLTTNVIEEFGGNSSRESILWGMYGPTEAAIHCTLQPNFQSNFFVGNIGFPLDSVSALIAAPVTSVTSSVEITALPFGDVGELVIGGPQVADGYLNRDDLSAAAFVRHSELGLLYRTGDKARFHPNGTIECLGRIVSGQVKLRGQRVELGEIEQILYKADGVHTVAAVVIDDSLVAFCSVNSSNISKAAVTEICKRWLPNYMVPADIVFVPQMPQSASGKIDKMFLESNYLRERYRSNPTALHPISGSGLAILRILRDVLDDNISLSLNTTLETTGLDSLRSIKVASLLREEGYNVGALDVLSALDLEELISICESKKLDRLYIPVDVVSTKLVVPELLCYQDDIVDIISCTPLQEAMLAETTLKPEAYCNWIEIELSASYTFTQIRGFLEKLIDGNEILRSGFHTSTMTARSFVQVIWKKLEASQITEVTSFSKRYSLGSMESILRPLRIQINATLARPHLLFQIHHALYDGWSFDILLRDLSKIIEGKKIDERPQYREVVNYFLKIRANSEISAVGSKPATSSAYWCELLKDFYPISLPNFNGKTLRSSSPHTISRTSSVNAQSLSNRAREHGLNVQVFFQAAVAHIIGLYLGSSDIVIGTVTSGRTIPVTGIEKVVGPCIASLPLRVDLSHPSPIREMLGKIHGANRDMLEHCTLPLREITKICNLRPGTRLFDVLFVWQQTLSSNDDELALVKTIDHADKLEFALTLEFEPRRDSIICKATYDSAIFPEKQINYLHTQIDELVNHFIHDIDGKAKDIGRCFSSGSLSIANPHPFQERFLHGPAHAVERWASDNPESEALVIGAIVDGHMKVTEKLTYAALNERANQLAHALQKYGPDKGELICVLMEKSINLYVSILAILKIGSGYLPIVPDTPPERTSKILADARVRFCISEKRVSKGLRDTGLYKIVDIDDMDLSTYCNQTLDIEYNGSHLAYAVFTSGSTGTPKGVLVTQDNLMSNLSFLYGLYPTSTDSRLLQACSQAFDVSVFEIFFTWYAGMCLCTATKDDLFHSFEDSINRLEITHLSLTPTVASLVNPDHVPKVKFLVTAGEAVNEHVKRQWAGKGLYQGYGPSETTNICTVRPAVTSDDLINNIGPPFSNTSALVLEPGSDRIVPRGGVGELCFGGAQVFRGYLNMPELNATKIINHPLYGRIYRSGDMGILLPDDSILFTGRIIDDGQVKIRGQRVELGEITSNVLNHATVRDCFTLLFRQNNNTQRLITFWVPKDHTSDTFTALMPQEYVSSILAIFESLSLKLPVYMVPTHLVPITRIPLTSQTKIDKVLLQTTFESLSIEHLEAVAYDYASADDAETFSEVESKITEALAQTISIPLSDIRRTSSFFNLGLDSVSAINFSTRLRHLGMTNISISTILKNPTVALLSSTLSPELNQDIISTSHEGSLSEVFPSEFTSRIFADFERRGMRAQKILPCTPLQEAMLSSASSPTKSPYYNNMIFRIVGNISRIKECWNLMIGRHEILRTAFVPTDISQCAFAQVVMAHENIVWDDLRADEDIDSYAQNVIPNLLNSFHPPVRLAISKVGTTTKLVFCCHHALYDGLAISILLQELQDAYMNLPLPPPVAYDCYLQHMVSQDLEAADNFWKSSLASFEPTCFPSLSVKAEQPTASSSSTIKTLKIPLDEVLKACQNSSVSLLPVIQAAWAKLLYFYTSESDLCFGNVVSGRTLPEEHLDRLVAPCFNTLPVRLVFDFQRSNSEMIQRLHVLNIASLPFQLTPLRRIQAKTITEGAALFDTLVILQQVIEPLDQCIWSLEQDVGYMDLPIVCEVFQDKLNNQLKMALHYQTSLLLESDAKLVTETFEYALGSLIRFPDSAAGDTAGFPSRILAESNMNFKQLTPIDESLLHAAMERNVVARPESTALDFQHANGERTTWAFRTLNEKANQIAYALIQRNVNPDDIIPVHILKSPQFYASILGILKAGAAFTPIHPDLPNERKRFMLDQIKPAVMLCANSTSLDWCNGLEIIDVYAMGNNPKHNPIIAKLAPTNLAYILYTSGSTGLPKAVSMDHRSPIQTIESSKSLIPWTHDSRLLQYAAITFDMCYYDCFLAWSFGFTLCAAEQNTMLNEVTSVIRSLEVDLLDLTPSVAVTISRADVPGVKWLYCIGEAMVPEIVEEWKGACVNSYGPSETAFCTTIFPVQGGVKNSIIGKPFPTTSFAVFPVHGQRSLPVFGLGELYIGGTQLARGYYGNATLTDERFIQRNGQRFYKSGDIVRMLGGGNFEYIGRTDEQVKIRGLRVELGEINHVIQNCDKYVSHVSTQILKRDEGSKSQLVAFLVAPHYVNDEERSELRRRAKREAMGKLPAYMVPQFFIFVDHIPKSMAGKVDKNALETQFRYSSIPDQTEHYVRTHEWTETETCIREILARLSQTPIETIFSTTSIYQLGLDSISAVQVAAALRKKGFVANAANVMKYTSCADLAAYLDQIPTGLVSEIERFDYGSFDKIFRPEVLRACAVKNSDIETIRPCTPLQKGMLSQFIAKDGAVYFNYLRLRLSSSMNIDTDRMRNAWSMIVERHLMLRTGFAHIKDKKHSFIMLHYTSSIFTVPWDEESNSHTVEEWLEKRQQMALEQLHHPMWSIRVSESCIDLAIFHALFDATSLHIVLNDVLTAYRGLSLNTPTPLEPLLSEILTQSSEDVSRKLFWETLGKGAISTRFPNMAPLRYDPEPPIVVTQRCTKSLSDLEAGCRTSNMTLQAAGLASWASLLSAYTGETSVTFGVVLSGRTFEAAEFAVFPCITTVPFVSKVSDNKANMVQETMALSAEIQQHQFTPLNEIQRLMGFSNEVLFDSLFAFQRMSNVEGEHDAWDVIDEKGTIEYPISIEMEPKNGHLELRLTFLPHIVPKEQAVLILQQLDHLINQFVFLKSASLTDTTVDQKLYSITPAKEDTLSSDVTLLHEMFEVSAMKHRDRVALEFATSISNGQFTSNTLTYAELDAEGNKIAHMLIAHGICQGELVGICFDKCPEASFAILGILKAGCAFVALDPGVPSARRAFIIEDSRAKVVLSMQAQSSDMRGCPGVNFLNLDELDLESTSATRPTLQRPINPQDCSYCLYTSGTTGTPKGCELTHENAVQALLAFQQLFAGHWDEQSRWLQFASFHFDVSVLEQYWSWSVGICVVSAPRDLLFEDLATSIRTLGITHIDLTPSLARIIHPDDVPDLCKGVFITGGESLKQEILDVWGPKGVIYNGYGPTEATIGCTMYARVPANGKPSNIGRQFDNVGSYVFRPGTEIPVLRGAIGELCVSGKLVGKGYLNRSELTQERFPHLNRFHERVYRTGDMVRILNDGAFDFLGRADEQVKLRGQRLEIGEINTVIMQAADDISDMATLVLRHPKQRKDQLVSFIVTTLKGKGKGKPKILLYSSSALELAKEACREKLPGYMVPTHFVALTALPLSANNKADGRKLKEMYKSLSISDLRLISGSADGIDDKWSKQEKKLRDVLVEMLEIRESDIKKGSSFFELGLDSVSIIGFSRALKSTGFSKAAASMIMQNTSISKLAKALSEISNASGDRGSIDAALQSITAIQHRHRRRVAESLFTDPREVEAMAPCTPLQQGLIARSLDSEHGLYFNAFYFKLNKNVDTEKLQNAWQQQFYSTQILRTIFSNTEDGYVQAALRRPRFPWKVCSVPMGKTLHDYLDILKKEWWQDKRTLSHRPFEITLVDAPEGNVLAVHIFHALYDGNCIGLMFKSVWETYNNRLNEGTVPSFQSCLAYGPLRIVKGAREFWKDHISDMLFKPFPPLADEQRGPPTTVTRDLPSLPNYESVRRRLNVAAQSIAQACWAIVLHRYTKNAITLGMVVSGRSIDFENADSVVGPLFNTIPYHHCIRANDTWASIIKRTHDFNIAANPYQHTPLRDIVKWCKRGPNQPLFDTLFVYQIAEADDSWQKNDIWELEDGGAEADYSLALEVEQQTNGYLGVTLVAQGHVLDERTSNRLLDDFEKALKEALGDPEAPVEGLTINNTETRPQLEDPELRPEPLCFDGAKDFQWTHNALKMREEIANLVDADIEDINETTSIFELGLDSIDAIKLSSKLKKHGIDLPVSNILRGRTIANTIFDVPQSKRRWAQGPSDMIFKSHIRKLEAYLQRRGGKLDDIEQVLPLTPLQEAMVAEMIASDYTRYWNHDVLKLAPDTDVERLRDAWMQVVKDSPILRTSFIEIDDPHIDFSFAQTIRRTPHAFWKEIEVGESPDFSEIFTTIRGDVVRVTQTAPLFHVHLVSNTNQKYLVLSIAHALYDGWSLGLLHYDVHRAYSRKFEARPKYDSVLHRILTTSGADAAAFWRDYLSDAKSTHFSPQHKVNQQSLRIVHREEHTSKVMLSDVIFFAKKNKISLQTLGQTVYALVLAHYTQSLDVTFGSVLSGRDDETTSKLMFPTMNTVAIRIIIHGNCREMLQYVQDNFENVIQWQHFPLRKAQALAGIQGNVFGSLFIYQKRATGDNVGKKLYESVEGQSDVEYPVCVEMETLGAELVWRCAVKEEVLDKAGAQDLLARLDRVLEVIVSRPDAPTVEFMAAKKSICGLPTFQDEQYNTSRDEASEAKDQAPLQSDSATAKAIRETLAFVSKTPEDEIAEGMTIFHIGLDSISAIKVSSLLRKRSVILSVGEMLKAGTVEKMAKVVDGRVSAAAEVESDAEVVIDEVLTGVDRITVLNHANIEEENVEQLLPATAGQMYMLSMFLNSNGVNFYPRFTYKIDEPIAFSTLQAAWRAVVNANPILRTCLLASKDNRVPYVQVVLKKADVEIVDATDWNEQNISDAMKESARRQPYYYIIAALSSNSWKLTLRIHHALYDGVSLPLLMQQVQDYCNGDGLPAATNTFNRLLANSYNTSALRTRKVFWTHYLSGITQHRIPQPSSPPVTKTEIFKLGLLPSTKVLDSLARKNGVSTQSLFLAAYTKIYAAFAQAPSSEDAVIGIYLANRSLPIPNIASAAIPTMNLVPLRVPRPLQTDILDMAAQIQYDIQEISIPANSSASLSEVYEWTRVRIDTFVNFLKLPDVEKTPSLEGAKGISITPLKEWEENVGRVKETSYEGFEAPKELVHERVRSAYLHAIDIEATIRNGALDVGVFAPEGMVDMKNGEKLIEDIRQELEVLRDAEKL